MFTIVGGTYREVCVSPAWDQLYGSGLRAAIACADFVASAVPKVELVTWVSPIERSELEYRLAGHAVEATVRERAAAIEFRYEHPLASPRIYPPLMDVRECRAVPIDTDVALVFGILEARAAVRGSMVVYDPQAGTHAVPFSSVGSATRLCIVANLSESRAIAARLGLGGSGGDPAELGRAIMEAEKAEAVIVKDGVFGATVVTPSLVTCVPCYQTDEVFKIGSGDVFSAIFWASWAVLGKDVAQAADTASRAAAYYCGTRCLPIPAKLLEATRELPPRPVKHGKRRPLAYLAAPLFNMPERWFVDETKRCLEAMGFNVFSPLHEVGCFGTERTIAAGDLAGLDRSDMVFALVDHCDAGTVFEVGYAVAKGKPVVAYGEHAGRSDLTMLVGSGVRCFTDYCTAVHHAAWVAGSLGQS